MIGQILPVERGVEGDFEGVMVRMVTLQRGMPWRHPLCLA